MTTKTSTSVLESNPARGEIRGIREINRRRMKAPRPAMTRATAYQVRLWCAEIERARAMKVKNGGISKGADRYLKLVKGMPTVQAGGWCDTRDAVMAKWLNCSRHTVLRHRHETLTAGLLEDKGTGGRDHKPCLVRPIMRDGSPVFTGTFATLSVAKIDHQQVPLLELPEDSSPLTPPTAAPEPSQTCGPAPEALDAIAGNPTESPPTTAGKGLGNEGFGAKPVPLTFEAAWAASGKVGLKSFAETQFDKLTDAERAALGERMQREGRLDTGDAWFGKWLQRKGWRMSIVPTVATESVFHVELGALGAQLRRLLDPALFRAWFVNGEARLVSKTHDTVTLAVKSRFFANHIAEQFSDAIRRASGVPGVKIMVREGAR
jgi:hypothetical protein